MVKDKIFKKNNTEVVIARYKEPIDWVHKLKNYKNVFVYEKENQEKDPYNVPKNKGNEASAYLKYIVDNYDNLPNHVILIHCHEDSWHHHGSIVEILDTFEDKEVELENLNKKDADFNMGNYQNWKDGDLGQYYSNCMQPAVGKSELYPDFTLGEIGCAQYIIHKDVILFHTKKFYENIYKWILDTDVSYYNHGYYLEWTWELFWKKCMKNFFINKYKKEKILNVLQLDKKFNFVSDITKSVIEELEKNDHYKIKDKLNITILKENGTIETFISGDNYIVNKYL